MKNKTHIKIITPDGVFLESDIYMVTVRTSEGNIGLQHGKTPFVASIEISELSIYKEEKGKPHQAAIAGGLVYASPTEIKIITDAIEYKENIELSRAEKYKKELEIKLKQKLDESQALKLQISLKKAINRISIRKS